MAKAKYLYDDFSTTIATSGKWTTTNALTGVVTGGQMRIRPTTGYDAVESTSLFDLRGSHLGFKLVQNCTKGQGTNTLTMVATVSSGNSVSIWIEGGRTLANAAEVYLRETVSGVNSDTTFTYDPSVHVWFRIREDVGTVYWETSVDGTNWTIRRSKTTTLDLSSILVSLESGYYGAEAGTTYATIDDFNLWAGPPPALKMTDLTDDFTFQDTSKWTFDPGASVIGDNLEITAASDYSSRCTSVSTYDLTDSYLSVEMLQNLPAGTGSFTWYIDARIDNNNYLRIALGGGSGNVSFEERVAGTSTSTSVSYLPLKHRFFRIRSVGTTISWETSADGESWTIQRSKTTALALTALRARIAAGYYGSETVTGIALFDNVNIISGSAIGEGALPAELLVDDFGSEDATKWFYPHDTTGDWSASGGQLVSSPSTVDIYAGVSSFDAWDLSNSYFAVQFVQNANRGTSEYVSITTEFSAQADSDNKFGFRFDGGTSGRVLLRHRVGGVDDDRTASFDTTRDKWFRLRGAGTTIYWETSFDSVTWTIKRSATTTIALDSVKARFVSGFWDVLESDAGTIKFDNFNLVNKARLKEIGWSASPALPMGGLETGTVQKRVYLQNADWLWNEIPPSPVLDPDSETIGYYLTGAGDWTHGPVMSWGWYGNALVLPNQVHPDTPRYKINIVGDTSNQYLFDPYDVPIPLGTQVPPGSDSHLVVADPVSGKVFSFWQAHYDAGTDTWSATYGGISDLSGDGRDFIGSATATNLSRLAGVIRISELQAGEIPHALFVASNMCRPGAGWVDPDNYGGTPPFKYPAQKSDGRNLASVPVQYTVVQGARLQLDPSIDLESVPNITPIELAIGKAWQRYGAYVGDQGGNSWPPTVGAGQVELWQGQDYLSYDENADPILPVPPPLAALGVGWDYFALNHIPWEGNIRVLKNWNGSA